MYLKEPAYAPTIGDRLNLADAVEIEMWSKALNRESDLILAATIAGPDYGDLVA